jgi:nitrile hydratase beta subunit
MNGVHDLGGVDGFGAVEVEANEPVFHHPWERVVFGLVSAMSVQRLSNTHTFRHAIERMDPTHYLGSPYYEHWLTALATLVIEKGLVTRAELEARAGGQVPLSQALRAGAVAPPPASAAAPRFAVGSTVVVRNLHPLGHTRCPRYIRGKHGVVARVDGLFPLPDVAAHASARCKQYAYNVRFDGRALWGDAADSATAVYVDLWESYLEAP